MTRAARERKAIAIAFLLVLIVFVAGFLQVQEDKPASSPSGAATLPPDISK